MAAQLDTLQDENNGFKIATEQLSAEINNLNTANDRLRTEMRASDFNTADTMRRTATERDAAQNTVKDLGARIAAMDLERASGEGRFKNQIAALESEKKVLKARNGELEEQLKKLEKVFKDIVGGFEAYKKGIRRAGE